MISCCKAWFWSHGWYEPLKALCAIRKNTWVPWSTMTIDYWWMVNHNQNHDHWSTSTNKLWSTMTIDPWFDCPFASAWHHGTRLRCLCGNTLPCRCPMWQQPGASTRRLGDLKPWKTTGLISQPRWTICKLRSCEKKHLLLIRYDKIKQDHSFMACDGELPADHMWLQMMNHHQASDDS